MFQILQVQSNLPSPSNLRLENLWAYAADVRWQPSLGTVVEYRIAISRDGVNFDNAGVVGPDRTGFRLNGLSPNTRYWVKVRARRGIAATLTTPTRSLS